MVTHLIVDPLPFLYGMAIFLFFHEHMTRVFVSGHLYQEGQALQFNWILEKGGFASHGNGSFLVDYSRVNSHHLI
jgi:hypothetical protein